MLLEESTPDEPSGGRPGRPPLDETPEGLLRSDPRSRILRLIEKNPGIRVADLIIEADMASGTFYHHMGLLKKAGLVETATQGGIVRAFPAGKVVTVPVGPLDSEAVRNVARAVLRKPGASSGEIAEALGQTPRAVRNHLTTLIDADLVVREAEGLGRRYYPTPALRTALERRRKDQ